MRKNYNLTTVACSTGYVLQAIVNNFLPLLFVYFVSEYKISLELITVLVSYNFILQIFVDLFSSNFILKVGYRKAVITSAMLPIFAFILLAITAIFFENPINRFIGIFISVTVMAMGSGLSEVLLSPIIEAIPFENKSSKMSFLHSFYALGHFSLIIISTVFFVLVGIDKWYILILILTVVPIFEIVLFSICPILPPDEDGVKVKKSTLFKDKTFILLFILMICAGASEQSIAQWASYFAETGLKVSKTLGDLIGASVFALFMFLSRFLHGLSKDRFNLIKTLILSTALLAVSYMLTVLQPIKVISLIFVALCGLFVGIAWPAIYSIGGKLFTYGGTVMFSMLALGGDLGCSLGPMLVGFISSKLSIEVGILSATIFPIILLVGLILLKNNRKNDFISIDKKV